MEASRSKPPPTRAEAELRMTRRSTLDLVRVVNIKAAWETSAEAGDLDGAGALYAEMQRRKAKRQASRIAA
jgi:hypothetical protein